MIILVKDEDIFLQKVIKNDVIIISFFKSAILQEKSFLELIRAYKC